MYAISHGSFDYGKTFPNSKNGRKFSELPKTPQLIAEYLEKWLDDQKPRLKASTFDGYRKVVHGHLIPLFGALPLSEVTRKAVRDALRPKLTSNKTLANMQSVLRKALSDAVDEYELLVENPLSRWTFRNKDTLSKQDDIDPFTSDEQSLILMNLPEQGRNLIQFAIWTGLRTSELVALDWADIDFVRGVVRVSRAWTQKSAIAEVPKTTAGRRDVKLLRPALEALHAQKTHTWLNGTEIFQNPRTGQRWTGDQPLRKTLWTAALKRAGVRYRNPYQTRHTYASMMLSAGEHPMWVAAQMGHADWTMIARVYGRWMPEADPDAGLKASHQFGYGAEIRAATRQQQS